MHQFFGALRHTLATRPFSPTRAGSIVFRVLDDGETWRVSLGESGGELVQGDDADASLRIFCDNAQLDDWLAGRWERPLRCEGDRSLLGVLGTLLEPATDPSSIRRRRNQLS